MSSEPATQSIPITHPLSFDERFAFEVALRYEPINIVMQRYGVSIDQLKRLKKHKPFVMAVRKHQKEIAENGIDFKMKAKLMANDLIDTAYLMAKDPKTPATVRSGQIKDIVRWAELEPQKGAGDSEGGTMFNIQINL